MVTLNLIPESGYLQIELQDDSLQIGDAMVYQDLMSDNDGSLEVSLHQFSGLISTITIRDPCGSSGCPEA